MTIIFNKAESLFHLQMEKTSYVIKLYDHAYLMHVYWGKKIRAHNVGWFCETPYRRRQLIEGRKVDDVKFTSEYWPFEYPSYGTSDFRPPAVKAGSENGTMITDLRYVKHRILKGKPLIDALPSTYVENENEAETLEIELYDSLIGLSVFLYYTVYNTFDVITRHAVFANKGTQSLTLHKALSASIDFKDGHFEMLQLSGTTLRERHVVKRKLAEGLMQIDSTRGISSHIHNPFIALLRDGATEHMGEVYGLSLVYSGNFVASAHVDQYFSARVQIGINPFNFLWVLEPGKTFSTPEAVMVYSDEGLNGLSHKYHDLYRKRLCRGIYRDRVRPVLVNNWEATYFDFDHDKIISMAKKAKESGIELFVLDDGWFGSRNNDQSSLGDWHENTCKLPKGLKGLADEINALGLKFGLWFEPEAVSPDSELYRKHPDWCISVPGRKRTEWRNQLVLDLARKEVCDYIIHSVATVLNSANIEYVKWDMNRRLTEMASASLPPERQMEFSHRYILGLYNVLEELTSRFPNVLFENCASGGGRFDPGMLYYFPQTWTSDNTDAVCRLKIQYGTSICYPLIATCAHVSAIPNHQVLRSTPMKMRGPVAMSGNMGYELDLTNLTEYESNEVMEQVALYKEMRSLVQFGRFYRLKSPFDGNQTAWMVVSDDKREFVVWFFRVMVEAEEAYFNLRLAGIDAELDYICLDNGMVYSGDALLNMGLTLPWQNGDHMSLMMRFSAV